MRFNESMYRKAFPEVKAKPVVESAVETFKPSEQLEAESDERVVEVPEAEEVEEVEEDGSDLTDDN